MIVCFIGSIRCGVTGETAYFVVVIVTMQRAGERLEMVMGVSEDYGEEYLEASEPGNQPARIA